jgi:hypothetical protein
MISTMPQPQRDEKRPNVLPSEEEGIRPYSDDVPQLDKL